MFMRIAILVSALALSACTGVHGGNVSNPALGDAAAVTEGPPTVGGVYAFPDCEGEGGCSFRNWRTVQATQLFPAESQASNVIGTLTPGEWVHVEDLETRLVPQRGIVRAETQDFHAGEVVYSQGYEGEGFVSIWRRGEYISIGDDDPVQIDWQGMHTSQAISASLGTWARVKRDNGQVGWVHLRSGHFECLGSLSGDPDCRD